jgi:hypothetical protein
VRYPVAASLTPPAVAEWIEQALHDGDCHIWRNGRKVGRAEVVHLLVLANHAGDGNWNASIRDVRDNQWKLSRDEYELDADEIRGLMSGPHVLWPERLLPKAVPNVDIEAPPTRKKKGSDGRQKEPSGWQARRVLRVMRTKLHPPNGKAPRSKELKVLEGEIATILAQEEKGKPAPSPEIVSKVVKYLGRSSD